MNLIISFSGRENGNCDQIAKYISSSNDDKIIFFRNMNAHECGDCKYECFTSICKYRDDDIYELYGSMCDYDKIYLIVPMYCGNPSSLYFKYNERSQDFFIHNENSYEIIMKKLYVVGVYGDREKNPEFLALFEKLFEDTEVKNHVLGIERHRYGQKIEDDILDIDKVRVSIDTFVRVN